MTIDQAVLQAAFEFPKPDKPKRRTGKRGPRVTDKLLAAMRDASLIRNMQMDAMQHMADARAKGVGPHNYVCRRSCCDPRTMAEVSRIINRTRTEDPS